MENVGLGEIVLIFAHVFESGRGAVVTVRNDHFVLDDQGAYLSSLAVTVFCPYIGHPQIAEVQFFLFVFLAFHCRQFCGVVLVIPLRLSKASIFGSLPLKRL